MSTRPSHASLDQPVSLRDQSCRYFEAKLFGRLGDRIVRPGNDRDCARFGLNPVTSWWSGNNISINLGEAGSPEAEAEILRRVGTYGRQLGKITDGVLAFRRSEDNLRYRNSQLASILLEVQSFAAAQNSCRKPKRNSATRDRQLAEVSDSASEHRGETNRLRLLFLDDAGQKQCSRPRIGRLVAIGGIAIEASACRALEVAVDELCMKRYGFPEGEPFKWSPNKDHWMRDNLIGAQREQFLSEVLKLAAEHGAVGLVTVSDATKGLATSQAETHEMDVLILTLERFDLALEQDIGMVIAARPSGGRPDEDKFLVACAEAINAGTDYVRFKKIVANVVTMPFANSRLLQLADLIASITTAMVAGHEEFAGKLFPAVKSILRSHDGRIGGIGLKIHPDYSYANLYHWLLGDLRFKHSDLPIANRPFPTNEDNY